jgi:glycosyltransferase involved in cell wall biosynthesis
MISVIIPTLNEEASIPALFDAIRQQETESEVIVVDGGSRDRTLEVARGRGVRSAPDLIKW